MNDLCLALVILVLASACLFLLGVRLSRSGTEKRAQVFGALTLMLLLVYAFRFHGTLRMAQLLPVSNALILANWLPPGGAFLAGIVIGLRQPPLWRRVGLALIMVFVTSYSVACCFQGRVGDPHKLQGSDSVQSWDSSCGPCCAAELLQHHGIDATEEELAELCVTSQRGCPALGLYRGLKLKTAGTDWDVVVVHCSVAELLQRESPLLLRVSLVRGQGLFEPDWSQKLTSVFMPEHAILLLGKDSDGWARVFDPAIPTDSQCAWSLETLQTQWKGEALQLVRRRRAEGVESGG